jgi:glycosyltransferase involved in cell wall biosynthesis
MRILFIAMANSVHVARWIGQVAEQGWDVHLFPVEDHGLHPALRHVTVHDQGAVPPLGLDKSVRVVDDLFAFFDNGWPFPRGSARFRQFLKHWKPEWEMRAWRLAQVIRKLRPDIIHSLEFQHAGYLTLEARKYLNISFPKWMVSCWGSDIYLFGRLAKHVGRVEAILSSCDYYWCDCKRDVELARKFGLRGEVLPVLPVAGGFNLELGRTLRQPGPTSARRIILLKGYQMWAGRALVGLRAIELCADVLQGYSIAIYLAAPDVELAAELLFRATGIPIEIIPQCSHEDMLRLFGRARVSIGLSISDGIPLSFLEAMVMGAFPIQSCTACVNEWIEDGVSGFIVPGEDPEPVAAAIRRAVTDDALVDRAAEINARTAQERLDQSVIQPQVVAMYEKVFAESRARGVADLIPPTAGSTP